MNSQQASHGKNPPPIKHSNTMSVWIPKAAIILCLAFIAVTIYGISVTNQKNVLDIELTDVRSHLTTVQNDLSSTRQTLASTQTELGTTKQSLASTQTELGTTKKILVATQTELGNTQQTLNAAQTDLNSIKQTLVSTQTELGTTKQTLAATQTELETTNQILASTQTLLISTNQTLNFTRNELNITKSELSTTQQQLAAANIQLQSVTAEKNLMLLQWASIRDSINSRLGYTSSDRQRSITPYHPSVNSTVISQWGAPVDDSQKRWEVYDSMLKWVIQNIYYSYDSYIPLMPNSLSGSVTWVSEYWRTPSETLSDKTGDCEDMALLLASMMKNYNQNKYAVWVIELDSSKQGNPGHVAVAFPVVGGRLSILDPAGQYYTGMYQYNQLSSDTAAIAINEWMSHWSQDIPGAYVSRIFSQNEEHSFSSNAEFLSWLDQR